ncbi:MAG: hypothetical protein ACK5RW_02835, partial [bacterium]
VRTLEADASPRRAPLVAAYDAALRRLQAQLDGVCARVDAADKPVCEKVLRPAPAAPKKDA